MSWSKFANNPVIARQPSGYDSFRDPYIWKDGSNWYMIVGCGSYGNGTVLLYRSSNLVNWTFLKPLYSGSSGAQGYFWEMPSLVKITSSKYVLFINALCDSQPAKNLYWVGTWSNETFTPDYAVPKQMDTINWMLSPSVFADGSGELLAIGIVPEKRSASDVLRAGWAHLFCLPRVLHLNLDGTLYQEPISALQQLRDEYYHYENLDIVPGQDLTSNIKSEQLEILLDIDLNQSQLAGITVLKSPDGTEQTRIYYDKIAKVMTVECIPGVIESGTFELNGSESLKLHVFVDHSVIDVFANGRAFATRAYPSQSDSNGVSLYVNGGTAHINSLKIWKLKSSVVRN